MTDDKVFRSIYPSLRRFAAACAPLGTDPDDLVQEAVARTLKHHALSDLDNAGAYLRTAVANLARNQYQARALRVAGATQDHVIDAYPSDLAAMDALSVDDRAALYLIDIEGCPFKEGAALLGCSTAALKARTIRARRRLRKDLEGSDGRP